MPNLKRPDKIKCDVVKVPAGLVFSERIGRTGSLYMDKLNEALASGSVIQIVEKDTYLRHQLKKAADKLKVKLVFAAAQGYIYIKPIAIEGESKRLLVLLREPRTVAYLQTKKLELHLENTLTQFMSDGLAHLVKGAWVLTEKGLDAL
jgi:hypothetical protein